MMKSIFTWGHGLLTIVHANTSMALQSNQARERNVLHQLELAEIP